MTEEENKVYRDKLEQSAMDALHMSCDEMDQDEQLKYMKVAKAQLEVAEALKPKSWWDKPIISVKDICIGIVAPIAGLIGAVYAANSRREEANINLEAKRLECDAQVKCEQIRANSRLKQLELITKSEELPDNFSLKVLNENDR